MWEDEANANGGKWVLTMKNNPALLDRCWSWLAMALVGEELEEGDEICGAVVSLRSKVDRIQVWTRNKEDVERLNGIGKKLVKLLDVSEADSIGLEFQVCFICQSFNSLLSHIVYSTILKIDHSPTNSCRFKQCLKHRIARPSNQAIHILDLLVEAKRTPRARLTMALSVLVLQAVVTEVRLVISVPGVLEVGIAVEIGKAGRGHEI